MTQRRFRWGFRWLLAGGLSALAFAGLASVGAAVSPSGTPAASDQYPKKVTICHRTHSKKNPFVTIRVSRNAVKAHLRHGDKLGPVRSEIHRLPQGQAHHEGEGRQGSREAPSAWEASRQVQKPKKSNEHGKGSREKKEKHHGKPAGKLRREGQSPQTRASPQTQVSPPDTPGKGGDKGKKH